MPDIDFGRQIGPLPLGAWVAVVGGGLAIAWYSRRSGSTTPVIVEDTSGNPGVGEGASGFVNASPITVDGPPAPTTNEEWARNALNFLIGQGWDANVADSAVRKYLESTQLSLQESAMIRFALVKLGAPPVPLPTPPPVPTVPPVVTPPPVVPVPTQPTQVPVALRYVIVKPWPSRYSTLSGIAYAYYGRTDAWHDIYNANRKGYTRPDGSPGFISNPQYLRPGDKLWVPGLGGPIR
jgi:hypothetical protein